MCVAAHLWLGPARTMMPVLQVQRKMIYQQRLGPAFRALLPQKSGRLLKLVFLVTSGPIHQLLAGHSSIEREDRTKESKEKRKKPPSSAKHMDQLLDSLLAPPPSPIHNLSFRHAPRWMLYQTTSQPRTSANRQISLKRISRLGVPHHSRVQGQAPPPLPFRSS